jgi:mannose-6-phosphate isomerase-like protein (cupin superfamily)
VNMRQIITGHDKEGKAVFLAEEEVAATEVSLIPGYKTFELWSTNGRRTVPHTGPFPGVPGYFPGEAGAVFRVIVLPPMQEGGADIELTDESVAEAQSKLPGFLDHLELDDPGMHTTDSIDFGIVLQGEIHLELDDGEQRCMRAGDCVVQNGTRHAWRNRSGEPVTMAFVLLGAERIADRGTL